MDVMEQVTMMMSWHKSDMKVLDAIYGVSFP